MKFIGESGAQIAIDNKYNLLVNLLILTVTLLLANVKCSEV